MGQGSQHRGPLDNRRGNSVTADIDTTRAGTSRAEAAPKGAASFHRLEVRRVLAPYPVFTQAQFQGSERTCQVIDRFSCLDAKLVPRHHPVPTFEVGRAHEAC